MKIITSVPTNIITGALGAGKTTLIQKLLEAKPADERWAVLVNEFGEIGIDAALLNTRTQSSPKTASQDDSSQIQSLFIREVPGGCMCCASSLPMHIALNQLLAAARPHRLLIEPTGLGHPKEVIETLGAEHYQDVIQLQSTLCVVDARRLSNPRWREHQTFKQQFDVADNIVITKSDLYQGDEISQLHQYLNEIGCEKTPVVTADLGSIDLALLKRSSKFAHRNKAKPIITGRAESSISQATSTSAQLARAVIQNPSSTVKKQSEGEGFFSCGWVWPAQHWFDFETINDVFNSLNLTRMKGVMITSQGIFAFNANGDELSISEYDEAPDSRLEIIADSQKALNDAITLIENSLSV
ncbi:CobW family GTP-binding protein [Ningiella sp. W23]|uniref:CobW family GTP-binding protein n=1 Tax=Ningiella sp. W23 TaxID=3023715 RepID=UPI003758007F